MFGDLDVASRNALTRARGDGRHILEGSEVSGERSARFKVELFDSVVTDKDEMAGCIVSFDAFIEGRLETVAVLSLWMAALAASIAGMIEELISKTKRTPGTRPPKKSTRNS